MAVTGFLHLSPATQCLNQLSYLPIPSMFGDHTSYTISMSLDEKEASPLINFINSVFLIKVLRSNTFLHIIMVHEKLPVTRLIRRQIIWFCEAAVGGRRELNYLLFRLCQLIYQG